MPVGDDDQKVPIELALDQLLDTLLSARIDVRPSAKKEELEFSLMRLRRLLDVHRLTVDPQGSKTFSNASPGEGGVDTLSNHCL
jgi:hypothetical protein